MEVIVLFVMIILFFASVVGTYVWGLAYAGAISSDFMQSMADPQTIATVLILAVSLYAIVQLLYRFFRGRIGATEIHGGLFSTAILLPLALLSFPFLLLVVDWFWSHSILDPACGGRAVSDYFLLAIDNLAKGLALDLLESFHIDLYACPPRANSFIASSSIFAIRSFTSYILIYAVIKLYGSRQFKRDMIIGH